jgi:hypothetical protein
MQRDDLSADAEMLALIEDNSRKQAKMGKSRKLYVSALRDLSRSQHHTLPA